MRTSNATFLKQIQEPTKFSASRICFGSNFTIFTFLNWNSSLGIWRHNPVPSLVHRFYHLCLKRQVSVRMFALSVKFHIRPFSVCTCLLWLCDIRQSRNISKGESTAVAHSRFKQLSWQQCDKKKYFSTAFLLLYWWALRRGLACGVAKCPADTGIGNIIK